MANSEVAKWSNGGDLFLDLSPERGRGLRTRIENAIRDAIRSGRLPRDTVLPATRTLARDLGVSRGTVMQAYAQLTAEGWITGRRGSGTRVAADRTTQTAKRPGLAAGAVRWRFDLRPGRPDASSFPRADWMRAQRRALAAAPGDAFDYGRPEGMLALRLALADYLARARGLRVSADDVIVTTGFTQSLSLIARALHGNGVTSIAMEEPSMPLHRSVVKEAGVNLTMLRVDDAGAAVEQLAALPDVQAAILTPNHQHPTGAALSPTRRATLLDWARTSDGYVVEDDYDGEFRYDGEPLGPVQGLDPSRVIYAGTVSKTLAPGVRLGWLIVPEPIRDMVLRQRLLTDGHNGALEQLAFTELLRSGGYDRHIRKMRLDYRRRRNTLLGALATRLPELGVAGAAAGLNLLIPLGDAEAEERVLRAATAAGLGLGGMIEGRFYVNDPKPGILVGYAASPEHNFSQSVDALVDALTVSVR
jgi:GntR family transcriptional regulator / MocR family aminotransferase